MIYHQFTVEEQLKIRAIHDGSLSIYQNFENDSICRALGHDDFPTNIDECDFSFLPEIQTKLNHFFHDICCSYHLNSADISPEDTLALETVIKRFIKNNK